MNYAQVVRSKNEQDPVKFTIKTSQLNVSNYINNLKRRVELVNSMYENALDTIENTEDLYGIEGLLDYINSRLEELRTLTNVAFTLSEVNWTGASAVVSWEELLDILYKLNIKFWT